MKQMRNKVLSYFWLLSVTVIGVVLIFITSILWMGSEEAFKDMLQKHIYLFISSKILIHLLLILLCRVMLQNFDKRLRFVSFLIFVVSSVVSLYLSTIILSSWSFSHSVGGVSFRPRNRARWRGSPCCP